MSEHPQRTKSMGITLLLTLLLGPLGLFYSTMLGAVVMLIVSFFVLLIVLLTGAYSFLLLMIWLLCVLWGILAAKSRNQKLLAGQR